MKKQAALASGKNTRSDWTAGETLGRQIASVFAASGRTDNAGKAVGTPAQWAQLEEDTKARGEIPWIVWKLQNVHPCCLSLEM